MANHFDLLRLAAALAVFAAHGDFLYRLHLPVPFPGHSLGSLAVYVFFFISGYLVCQSWRRQPMWGAFWLKRLVRVFPGLVVAVAFSVFVLGWAVTTIPSAAYWQSPETWLNFFNNAASVATVQTLPGVFESNPFARTVNGSLWTIRYELAMYVSVRPTHLERKPFISQDRVHTTDRAHHAQRIRDFQILNPTHASDVHT